MVLVKDYKLRIWVISFPFSSGMIATKTPIF
jgi:hypothetical protein